MIIITIDGDQLAEYMYEYGLGLQVEQVLTVKKLDGDFWDELYDFYFTKHHGVDVVKIETNAYIPGELTLVLGDITIQHIKEALLPFLPFREYVSPTFTQKAGDWLERNFPLEKSS